MKPNYDDLIQSWNKGCLELVDALVGYVPLTNQLCNAAAIACDFSFPGVFDYEVSSGFGRWFGEFILEHGGDEPSQKEAHAWLIKEIGAFFSQCATPEESETVKAAIRDAYFLNTQGVAK